MRILGIVGAGAGSLAEQLAPRLDGPVATIEAGPSTDLDSGSTAAVYQVAPDGSWSATGRDRSVDDLLDDLAPEYAHTLVLDHPDVDLPTVALGDAEASDVLLRYPDAGAIDTDEILDALSDVEPHVTLSTLVEQVKASSRADRAGAIATFTGRVRAKDDPDDSRTTQLEFEKYEGVAEERMATISRELEARDGVLEVRMHHRIGVIPDGEDIVFVVVLAGHREEAFRTVEDGINRLKDEVPIFKQETTVDEQFWVHDHEHD